MKRSTKRTWLSALVVLVLYAIGVWLSGWVPERGDVAVFIFLGALGVTAWLVACTGIIWDD